MMNINIKYPVDEHCLAVKVIIIIIVEVPLSRWSIPPLAIREPEVGSKSSGLLEGLAEHLVLLDIIIRH